jgi:hypothetical protein
VLGHALLLPQDRASGRFGRMRGEDRVDAQARETQLELLERDAVAMQPAERIVESAWLRLRGAR